LDLKTTEITSHNILRATAGTNCPRGGDAGHGGNTVLQVLNLGCTRWQVTVDDQVFESPGQVTIELQGDSEADTFLEALRFAATVIEIQLTSNRLPSAVAAIPAECINEDLQPILKALRMTEQSFRPGQEE
jgi:hypothetical protein